MKHISIRFHNIIYYIRKSSIGDLKFPLFLIKNEVSLGKNKFVNYLGGPLEMSFFRLYPIN
jgi:hypothetical protein